MHIYEVRVRYNGISVNFTSLDKETAANDAGKFIAGAIISGEFPPAYVSVEAVNTWRAY